MERATMFEFQSWNRAAESADISFSYRVHFADGATRDFCEVITLERPERLEALPADYLQQLLDSIHLVLGISYYKVFCPPTFSGYPPLTVAQAHFWNTVYQKGLGEFLFRNSLDPAIVAQFTGSGGSAYRPVSIPTDEQGVLIGIGGGKDSVVSLELLRPYQRTGFVVETGRGHHITDEVAVLADVTVAKIRRTLDPALLAGVPGGYNGHVPVSAIYAFLGLLEASLGKQKYVVVSNEYSSNFGNVEYRGIDVNHKWSGSAEFEVLFQDYVRQTLTPSIVYFSLTRPFYELRVMRLFTEYGQKYFQTFSSCNRNFTHTHDGSSRWCGACPKCAFTYLMLAAFVEPDTLVSIFQKDLLADGSLLPLYKDLLGYGAMKPFDCVGTFEESRVALTMAANNGWSNRLVVSQLLPLAEAESARDEVFKVQYADTVPSRFRLLGMRSVLLLGYGTEGVAAEKYLQLNYPHLHIGIADQKDGVDYLVKQHDYDICVRTPSLPMQLVTRQSVTGTQLFFVAVNRQRVIGVTGSKGKSTTATLIYELLRAAGVKVRLVGNIGVSALASLLEAAPSADETFVFELSSYQLEDLDVSPATAVVTSLFPEHLDHHGSLEAYYGAKRNIVRYQETADVFIHAPGFPTLDEWAKTANSNVIVPEPVTFEIRARSLRGEHMHANVALAFAVAQRFGVTAAEAEAALEHFPGLPHRLQSIGVYHGIEFYDDSISTTPESAIAGLRTVGNVDTIILGGVDRGYTFDALEAELRLLGVRNVILFPESGARILSHEKEFNVLHTASMDEAVQFALRHTAEGKACLLSPAAPSYNLFVNFEERGNAFINSVKKYGSA